MKIAPWYGILVGGLILLQWTFFLSTGAVPQLATAPWEIGLHISAEALLALTLIASGAAALQGKPCGRKLLLVGLGMAVYSEINSPGYFAQRNQWALVGMFAVLLGGAILSIFSLNGDQ